jgi:WD40 repeat protein
MRSSNLTAWKKNRQQQNSSFFQFMAGCAIRNPFQNGQRIEPPIQVDGSHFASLSPSLPATGLLEFAWRPDGAEALIGGTSLRVWKYTETAGATLVYDGAGNPADWVTGIMWETNGRYAIICGYDGLVLVYDPADSSIHQVNCDTAKNFEKGEWKPNGDYATVVRHN